MAEKRRANTHYVKTVGLTIQTNVQQYGWATLKYIGKETRITAKIFIIYNVKLLFKKS